jgi:hypothetical protein
VPKTLGSATESALSPRPKGDSRATELAGSCKWTWGPLSLGRLACFPCHGSPPGVELLTRCPVRVLLLVLPQCRADMRRWSWCRFKIVPGDLVLGKANRGESLPHLASGRLVQVRSWYDEWLRVLVTEQVSPTSLTLTWRDRHANAPSLNKQDLYHSFLTALPWPCLQLVRFMAICQGGTGTIHVRQPDHCAPAENFISEADACWWQPTSVRHGDTERGMLKRRWSTRRPLSRSSQH